MMGSIYSQPVARIIIPAMITATELSISLTTSKNAPFILMLSFEPAFRIFIPIRLMINPQTATISIGMPATAGGSLNRCHASYKIKPEINISTKALINAEKISVL